MSIWAYSSKNTDMPRPFCKLYSSGRFCVLLTVLPTDFSTPETLVSPTCDQSSASFLHIFTSTRGPNILPVWIYIIKWISIWFSWFRGGLECSSHYYAQILPEHLALPSDLPSSLSSKWARIWQLWRPCTKHQGGKWKVHLLLQWLRSFSVLSAKAFGVPDHSTATPFFPAPKGLKIC